MIDFGSRPCRPIAPSTTMTIGATARIGTICEQMIHGIRLFSSVRHVHDQHGEHDAERGAEDEAEQGRRERHPAVIDEAARRIAADSRTPRSANSPHHLVRRRHQRPLGVEVPATRSRDRVRGLLALERVAHQRRVHQHRRDVPDREQGRDHDGDGARRAISGSRSQVGARARAAAGARYSS